MIIYEKALLVVGNVARFSRVVRRHDADLARQMKKASTSVPLNMQEGLYSHAGNRTVRLQTAEDSARETRACLHSCLSAGYLTAAQVALDLDRLDHIVGGLWKLLHRPTPVTRCR